MFALGRSVAVLLLLCLKLCDGFVPNDNRVRAKRQLVNTCLVSNAVNFQCLKTYAQPRHSICYPYGIPQSCYINVEMQVTEGCTRTKQMCCNGFFNNINGCFGSFPGSLQGLETACSGHVRELSAPYGTVTSPNYPGTYPGNSNCRWMVITPPGGTTTIRVTSLNLHVPRQQCTTCQYGCHDAKLIIQDGDRKWSLCGSTLPSTSFTSRRASVLITFFVNAYSNFPAFPPIGFNLTYIITSPTTTPIPTTTVMTSPTMTSPTTTPLTSPTSTYVTSPALVGACGGSELKLAGPSGNVTSPGYPGLYPSNVNCRWMIVASPSSFVTVTVTDLQMEEASNLCNGVECRSVCHNDELVIEDTDQKWRLCGSTLPSSSFTARGKLVFLSFSTNGLKNYRGFRISYTVSVLPSGPTPPDVINTPVTSSTPPETHQATTTTYVPEVTTTEEAPVGLNRSFVFCLGDRVHVDCEPFCSLSCVRGVVTSPTCFARSCRPSCACPEDRPISYGTQCLNSEQCKSNLPAPCPGGMSHSQCKTCNRFCPGFGDPSKANQCGIIPGKCVSGCSCPRYFPYWHHDTCIPFALCPPPRPECTGGRYYTLCVGCTQACPKHGEQGVTLQCVNDPSSCVAGCACPGNLPVWHDGACIARNRCPAPKPKTVTCGKQYYKPKVKIVGGQWANQGSWPWIVQLIKGIFGRERHQCGGTLICANWVLTAAHCFLVEGGGSTETNTYIFRVNIGKHKRENDGDRPIVSQVIEAFYLHPQYDTISQANDIALIKLKTPVNMTKAIRPACVPNYIRPIFKGIPWGPLTGTRCYVIGWGLTENTGPNNTYLKQASLTIRPTSECYLHYVHFKPENMLCVGGQRKVDTCQGDSGGPLMCRHGLGVNATWYVDGVTSYGLKCGEVGYPGVYSRVTSYAKWIRQVTSGSADCRSSDQEWPEH